MSASPEPNITPTPNPLPTAPALPETRPAESTGYQPLSLLALASFILALGFAVPIVVGAVVAFIARTPLLLPPWLVLLGILVLLLAWVAQLQIRSSEGTLSGLALTRWAFLLCLVPGPFYLAYYGATYLAVTAQAEDFARTYLKRIAEGDLEKAFWMAVEPDKRSGDGNRDALEVNFNQPNEQGRAPFNSFCLAEMVRLVRNGGKDPTIDLLGINDWTYEQGGYRVVAQYRITSSLATFSVVVAAHGTTGPTGGRQWQILERGTGLSREVPLQFTTEGDKLVAAANAAKPFLDQLLSVWNNGDTEAVFLKSLPADEAKKVAAWQGTALMRGLACGPIPASDAASRQGLAARQRWFGGELLDTEPPRFWTVKDAETRASIIAAVRHALAQGPPGPGGKIGSAGMTLPLRLGPAGGEQLGFDIQMTLPRSASRDVPPLVIDAVVVLRLKTSDRGAPEVDGLDRIELRSGRSMALTPPPGGPGGGSRGR
jgi:hypothetical protein